MFVGQQAAALVPLDNDHFDWQTSLAPVASPARKNKIPIVVVSAFAPRDDVIQR
jgi:hypothetical protein